MVFSSKIFLFFFLPAVLAIYFLLRKNRKASNIFLTVEDDGVGMSLSDCAALNEELQKQYEKVCGPLTAFGNESHTTWDWMSHPAPWEYGAE